MEAQRRDIMVIVGGNNWHPRASDFESNLEGEIELMRQFQAGIGHDVSLTVGEGLLWMEPKVKEEKEQGIRSEK